MKNERKKVREIEIERETEFKEEKKDIHQKVRR